MQLTNEDMRARQQEGSYRIESAAARAGQLCRRQEALQKRSTTDGRKKAIEQSTNVTRTVTAMRESIARELLQKRKDTTNTKSTLPPLALSQRPTLRINDYDDDNATQR